MTTTTIEEPQKKKRGRPPKKLSPELVKVAYDAARVGLPVEQIARILRCARDTLMKCAGEEIDRGRAEANRFVLRQLFRKIENGDGASIFFWCKCRLGWHETNRLELAGDVSAPVAVKNVDGPPQESYEQWLARQPIRNAITNNS